MNAESVGNANIEVNYMELTRFSCIPSPLLGVTLGGVSFCYRGIPIIRGGSPT